MIINKLLVSARKHEIFGAPTAAQIISFVITALVVAADQYSKYLAVKYLEPIGVKPLIEGVIQLTFTTNRGAAFGMLSSSRWIFLTASAIAIIVMAAVLVFARRAHPIFSVSVAFMLGGGIGNMIDRLSQGYVVDFFEFKFVDFAIFNVADTCVTIGAVLMCLYIIVYEIKHRAPKVPQPAQDQSEQDA